MKIFKNLQRMLDISQRWKKGDEVKGSTKVKLRCGSDGIYRLIRKDSNQKLYHFFGNFFISNFEWKNFTNFFASDFHRLTLTFLRAISWQKCTLFFPCFCCKYGYIFGFWITFYGRIYYFKLGLAHNYHFWSVLVPKVTKIDVYFLRKFEKKKSGAFLLIKILGWVTKTR